MPKFRPNSSRIFLDTSLQEALSRLPMQAGRCLNVGCGIEGRYSELLVKFDVYGIDILQRPNVIVDWRYYCCDASQLPFGNDKFDLALAIESFEHIENNIAAMKEVARTLKPGGWLVITTPTHWTWPFELGRHGPHYYNMNALEKLICDAGLSIHKKYALGGVLFWITNLFKSWASPLGLRIMGKHWWKMIDGILWPLFHSSKYTDTMLPFPATNWLIIARKP